MQSLPILITPAGFTTVNSTGRIVNEAIQWNSMSSLMDWQQDMANVIGN